jgi:hypothetical protein
MTARNRRVTDPYDRWCGGRELKPPAYPIREAILPALPNDGNDRSTALQPKPMPWNAAPQPHHPDRSIPPEPEPMQENAAPQTNPADRGIRPHPEL